MPIVLSDDSDSDSGHHPANGRLALESATLGDLGLEPLDPNFEEQDMNLVRACRSLAH